MDEARMNALVDARLSAILAERFKDSATSPMAINPHGYNALFNNFGIEPGVPTTYIGPKGIESWLESHGHVQKSQYLNPVFEILTGQTASTGDDADGPCDEDVPIPGDLKVCNQTWPFGEFTMKSKVIRVDSAGALINRSEVLDLKLLNNPFGDANKIVHFSKWRSLEDARAFFESKELVEIRRQAGVHAPEFIYLDSLEQGTL